MPFPFNSRGKIEAWIGDDALDTSSYQSMFVGKLSDELRGMGRQDVYVQDGRSTLNKGAPQFFFPQGNRISFGTGTRQNFGFGQLGLDGLTRGEFKIELRDEILVVSYYLSYTLPLVLFSAPLLVMSLLVAIYDSSVSYRSIARVALIAWLFLLGLPYIINLIVTRKLVKNAVKSVRDEISLDKPMSTPSF